MDTNLGKVILAKNQIKRLDKDVHPLVNGFGYWPDTGKLIAVSSTVLSEKDKTEILTAVNNLPDTEIVVETIEGRLKALEDAVF